MIRLRYSYSSVSLFEQCSFKWFLRYGKKIKIEDNLKPDHPFKIGHLLHNTIEHGLETAANIYYNEYPIINNEHINEVIKVKHYYNTEIKNLLPESYKSELRLSNKQFIGYIDLVTSNHEIWDFKYSNNKEFYINSMQLHVYKYYYEKITGNKVNSLKYLFVPKIKLAKIENEGIMEYRRRLLQELRNHHVELVEVKYDEEKVNKYFKIIDEIEHPDCKLVKKVGYQCGWCEYEDICIRGGLK